MNHQIRPVSDDAVRAIAAERVLWQFSQNDTYSIAVGADGTVVSGNTCAMPFNYPMAAPARVTITSTPIELMASMLVALDGINSILGYMEFAQLVAAWKKSKYRWSSKAMAMSQDPNYLRIIGKGPPVVPFILRQLQTELAANEPDHWFVALWSITGENPVQPQHQGILREMACDWIRWGVSKGLINGAGVGV